MSRPPVNQHLRRNVYGLVLFFALHAVATVISANNIDDDHHTAHYVIHIPAFAVIVLYYFWVFKPLQNSGDDTVEQAAAEEAVNEAVNVSVIEDLEERFHGLRL